PAPSHAFGQRRGRQCGRCSARCTRRNGSLCGNGHRQVRGPRQGREHGGGDQGGGILQPWRGQVLRHQRASAVDICQRAAAAVHGSAADACRQVQELDRGACGRSRSDIRRSPGLAERPLSRGVPEALRAEACRPSVPGGGGGERQGVPGMGPSGATARATEGRAGEGSPQAGRTRTQVALALGKVGQVTRTTVKLIWKFNLALIGIFVIGFVLVALVLYRVLEANAREEALQNARIMMEAASSIRNYTNTQIKPLLETQLKYKFLPQSVPAFSATEQFNDLRKKYPEYFYKEATLNPTNPRDHATDWEVDVVNQFRQ